jgi:hypothetical protein
MESLMTTLIRVKTIEPLDGWVMRVSFTNDSQRKIDLFHYIADGEIFAPIRADANYFRSAFVDCSSPSNLRMLTTEQLTNCAKPSWVRSSALRRLRSHAPNGWDVFHNSSHHKAYYTGRIDRTSRPGI